MDIVTMRVGPLGTNCYLVVSEGEASVLSRECMVLDPGDEGPAILEKARQAGATITTIVLTHGHFDHTSAVSYLQEQTGADVMIGRADAGLLTDPGWMLPFMDATAGPVKDPALLKDGDVVNCGEIAFTVMETPGHSPGSICLYAPGHLFAGDLLFREGVGRTDLPGGSADQLFESLLKVSSLPDLTRVYPGHGDQTTIAHEKARNPFF